MELVRFLRTLQDEDALRAADTAVRLDRPEALPPFDPGAALWASERLLTICLGLQSEQTGANDCPPRLRPCPGDRRDPATHFSVDLTMRHLRVASTTSNALPHDDARRAMLMQLAHDWPLSSVGMNVADVDASVVLAHDGLRRTYVERILRLQDNGRRRDEATERAVATVLAEHVAFAKDVLAVHDAMIQRHDT